VAGVFAFGFSVIPTEVGRLFLELSFYERRPTQWRDRGTISNAPPSLRPNYKIASAIFIIPSAQPQQAIRQYNPAHLNSRGEEAFAPRALTSV